MTVYLKPGKSHDAQNVCAVIKGGIVLVGRNVSQFGC